MSAATPAFDLLKPIAGDDPCGPSLRYDPIYDKIRMARRQDSGGAVMDGAPKVADHKTAVNLITDTLATRTKDLQLAVWLADSLIHREGFAGLHRGLDLICNLLEAFWEDLHPKPEAPGDYDVRVATLEWLANEPKVSRETCPVTSVRFVPITANGLKWVDYIEKGRKDAPKSKSEEFEVAFEATPKPFYRLRDSELTRCRESLEILSRICDARFGKDGPGFSGLAQLLEELQNTIQILLRRKLEIEPDPFEEVKQVNAETAPPTVELPAFAVATNFGTAPSAGFGELTGLEPAEPLEAAARIVAAARWLRRSAPANPVGYLIVRALRWGEVRGGGAELQSSLLAAPTTEIRTTLRALAGAARWAELLEAAESAAAAECGRGWLDLQRYSVWACEKLGYASVARAIRAELACLLDDYPQLASATLLDDTGTANPETAAWLAGVRKKE